MEPAWPADDSDDDESLVVMGEPITRDEAHRLGIAGIELSTVDGDGVSPPSAAWPKSADAKKGPAGEAEDSPHERLEAIRAFIRQDDIDQALPLAQELVWKFPTLTPAKVLIARCFIARQEYPKAISILQGIVGAEEDPDALYFLGASYNHVEKKRDALNALRRCREVSADPSLRRRAQDAISRIQGGAIVCESCGKKLLPDAVVEKDDHVFCAACAKLAEDEERTEDGEEGGDGEETRKRRRTKLRRPLTRKEILIRAAAIPVFLFATLFTLYTFLPEAYMRLRSFLPESWSFIPEAASPTPPAPPPQRNPEVPKNPEPEVIADFFLSSPPLRMAVADVELIHKVTADGMYESHSPYRVEMFPAPAGPYSLDPGTGEFRWRPAREDAGRIFEIGFYATTRNIRSQTQKNTVTVSSGPEARKVADLEGVTPGDAFHVASADMIGDGKRRGLVVVHGGYWESSIDILESDGAGRYARKATQTFPGRPSGMGVVNAGGEPWVAVADFWNSKIRFFALRKDSLGEVATEAALPGKPLLAAADYGTSLVAVLYRGENGNVARLLRQASQRDTEVIGEWPVPDDSIWRRLFILRASREEESGKVSAVLALVRNSPGDNAVFVMDTAVGREWKRLGPVSGSVANATVRGESVALMVDDGQGGRIVRWTLSDLMDGKPGSSFPLPGRAAPFPMAIADLTGNGGEDSLALAPDAMEAAFGHFAGAPEDAKSWPLDASAEPAAFAAACVIPAPSSGGAADVRDEILYPGANGGLWAVSLKIPSGAEGEPEDAQSAPPDAGRSEQRPQQTPPIPQAWTPDSLRDMGKAITTIPEASARHLLWLTVTAPADFDAASVYASALLSPSPAVRLDVCDILIARGGNEEMRLLFGYLSSEKDRSATERILTGLTRQSPGKAIEALVRTVDHPGMPADIVASAVDRLRNLTKADLPADPVEWRDWWIENAERHRR